MIVRRSLTVLGAIASAGLMALTSAGPAAASGSDHTHYVYKVDSGDISGRLRIVEYGDKIQLCDVNRSDRSYTTAQFFWGPRDSGVRFRLTDGNDDGCAYSSASGAGAAKQANIPEGVTVRVNLFSVYGSQGLSNGTNYFSFSNDH